MELKLSRDVKHNKKGFCKDTGNKRKTRENVGPLLNKTGGLVTQDTEEAEVVNVSFLPQSLLTRLAFRNHKSQRPEGKAGARNMYSWWKRFG